MYVDNIKSPLSFNLKEIQDYTDEEMIEIELVLGHEFYAQLQKSRNILFRNKKINKILNSRK